ncbi:MAG: hypothetical protein R3E97_02220 [Candidatus Eisenbacteria bacterium]
MKSKKQSMDCLVDRSRSRRALVEPRLDPPAAGDGELKRWHDVEPRGGYYRTSTKASSVVTSPAWRGWDFNPNPEWAWSTTPTTRP